MSNTPRDRISAPLVHLFLGVGSATLLTYILVVGQTLLLPLVVAVFFWFLINATADGAARLAPSLPRFIHICAAVALFLITLWLPVKFISTSVPDVVAAAPEYQRNFENMVANILTKLNMEKGPLLEQMRSNLNLGEIASIVASAVTGLASSGLIVVMYIIFLFLEQGSFSSKIDALFPIREKREKIRNVISNISARVRTYILIKTAMSLITGMISYIVMSAVGLDFAPFWAAMIFLLNFIPSIGSIIGTIFPALLSLFQFDTLMPFFIIGGGIGAVQVIIGNFLEPRVMGNSLNLSTMVILLCLVFWGAVWGVAGAFLCVPLTVIIMIIFAEFKATRSIAILLSRDGSGF